MTSQVFFTLLILAAASYLAVGIASAALAFLHYIQHPRRYQHRDGSHHFNQDIAAFYVLLWPLVLILWALPKIVLGIARLGEAYLNFVDKLKGKLL